jgi:hypothetical protein
MLPPRLDVEFYVKDKDFLTSKEEAIAHFKNIETVNKTV